MTVILLHSLGSRETKALGESMGTRERDNIGSLSIKPVGLGSPSGKDDGGTLHAENMLSVKVLRLGSNGQV